jgi:uncharacterized protein
MKKLYVGRSKIEGKGIYSSEKIKRGEHIAFIEGELVKKKTHSVKEAASIPLWYGITDTIWLDPKNTIWRYFNHSCEPNTAIVGRRKLIALKSIAPDTELTFDYSMSDGDILWEMDCSCKTPSCRKKIHSIQRIPDHVYKKHLPYVPTFFKKLRNRKMSLI